MRHRQRERDEKGERDTDDEKAQQSGEQGRERDTEGVEKKRRLPYERHTHNGLCCYTAAAPNTKHPRECAEKVL